MNLTKTIVVDIRLTPEQYAAAAHLAAELKRAGELRHGTPEEWVRYIARAVVANATAPVGA